MHRVVHMFVFGLVLGLLPLAVGQPIIVRAASAEEGSRTWQTVRAHLPSAVPVLAPEWLPARFAGVQTTVLVNNDAISGGPTYRVSYRDPAGDVLLLALGSAVNSAKPTSSEPITIRGVSGVLETTPGWPPLAIVWRGGTWQNARLMYTVQAGGVSRDELIHVFEALASVKPGAEVTGLPDAGGGGASTDERAVLLAVALGGCLLLTGRLGRPGGRSLSSR